MHVNDTDFCGCISDASFWYPDRPMFDGAWVEHIPFAFWLIGATHSKTFVELGTFGGDSFFAFCQVAKSHETQTHLTAVDTWRGDVHVGDYDESIFVNVSKYREAHFPNSATLGRVDGFSQHQPAGETDDG